MTWLLSVYSCSISSETMKSRVDIAFSRFSAFALIPKPVSVTTGICPMLLGKPITCMLKSVFP